MTPGLKLVQEKRGPSTCSTKTKPENNLLQKICGFVELLIRASMIGVKSLATSEGYFKSNPPVEID